MMERVIRTRATGLQARVQIRHEGANGDPEYGVIVLRRSDVEAPAFVPGFVSSTPPAVGAAGAHQGQLFDPDRLVDPIHVEGGLRPDPLAGAGLRDVLALAQAPDAETRCAAAASRWNWDVRVQRLLAGDVDERVVLALLDATDPYVEACELIIDGPHVAARRVLAERNLRTELLQRLAVDRDAEARASARATLARRGVAGMEEAA